MSNEVLLSPEGYEKLATELNALKTTERQRIANVIREARSHGDLKENAMYHEAKLNQQRLEGRIAEIESVLQVAKIMHPSEDGAVGLGSKVTLRDMTWNDEMTLTLVGSFEADPTEDMISVTSPLGSALLGKEAGDEFDFEAPAGVQKYKVLSIE